MSFEQSGMAGRPNDWGHNPRDPPGGTGTMGAPEIEIPGERVAPLSRRGWLAAVLVGGLHGLPQGVWADEADEEAQVAERARKVGLGPVRSSRTEHYLGVGNAPDLFRNQALVRCGELAAA